MRKRLTKTELKNLKYLHINRDGMTPAEADKRVAELIEFQKTLPKKPKKTKPEFKKEFQKLMSEGSK